MRKYGLELLVKMATPGQFSSPIGLKLRYGNSSRPIAEICVPQMQNAAPEKTLLPTQEREEAMRVEAMNTQDQELQRRRDALPYTTHGDDPDPCLTMPQRRSRLHIQRSYMTILTNYCRPTEIR